MLSWSNINSTSGYTWQIATDIYFTNVVVSGETTTTTSIDPIHRPNFMTGTFYWRVIENEHNGISSYREVNIINPTE